MIYKLDFGQQTLEGLLPKRFDPMPHGATSRLFEQQVLKENHSQRLRNTSWFFLPLNFYGVGLGH